MLNVIPNFRKSSFLYPHENEKDDEIDVDIANVSDQLS